MIYELRNTRTGEKAPYKTTVEITERDDIITFKFTANNCQFYTPYKGEYNNVHSRGDACEILIGSDPQRKVYYEIEISPNNDLFLAKMTNHGIVDGRIKLDIDYIDKCFLKSNVELIENGYIATVWFNKNDILTGDDDIYFNAYRLETDGGHRDKHLMALNPTMNGAFHTIASYNYLKYYLKWYK